MSAPVVIPRLLVDAPPSPQPHKFGLFSTAVVLEDVEPHALTGVEYEAVCSTQVDPYPAPCRPGDTNSVTKRPAKTTSIVNGTPFAVYAADECVLGRDEATARRQLRERFLAGEEAAVERVVFGALLDNLPNLAKQAVMIQSTTPPDLSGAIGLLEQWLATAYGGVGVLHAPMTVAPLAQEKYQLGVNGPRAGTILGSAWAFGAGYPGTPPTAAGPGPDDGALWLYATPPVTIRRSLLIEPGSWGTGGFDRTQNLGFLIEERMYVVDWPCGVAAVKTSLTRPGYIASAAGPESVRGDLADGDHTTELPGLPIPPWPGAQPEEPR